MPVGTQMSFSNLIVAMGFSAALASGAAVADGLQFQGSVQPNGTASAAVVGKVGPVQGSIAVTTAPGTPPTPSASVTVQIIGK